MSENTGHGGFNHNDKPKFMEMYPSMVNDADLIKYYARKIAEFCKGHRCATCPFYTYEGICTFYKHTPDNWKGIEEKKDGAE